MADKNKKSADKSKTGSSGPGRSRTLERRQERQRQQRQQRLMIALIGGAVIVVLAIFLALVLNLPADAPIPEDINTRYAGITTGTTENGFPRLGEATGVVNVQEFSSFSCTFCEQFHADSFPALVERVKAGEISFTYVPMLTGSVPNAEGAARAALCAGEQGKFWEYHDILFDWHSRFVNQAFSPKRLSSGIEALGLDVNAYNECFSSERITTILNAAEARARNVDGYTGTPAVAINGVVVKTNLGAINTGIDTALALLRASGANDPAATEEPTTPAEEATPEATAEVTEEATAEATEEVTEEATAEATEEATPEATAEATEEATPSQ